MRSSLRLLQLAKLKQPRSNSIGFIGLGAMGKEMASNLVRKAAPVNPSKSAELPSFVILDVNKQTVDNFISSHKTLQPEREIVSVSDPESVAKLAGTVVTMLPNAPDVQNVYTNTSGNSVINALKSLSKDEAKNTLCIDCTTLERDISTSVGAELNKQVGAKFIDAPVSGGVVGARDGTLSFMVGGTQTAFDQAKPLLDLMGRRVVHCGDAGTGLTAKMANNLLLGISMIGTAEAMLYGVKYGLAPDLLAGILNSSTGKCWSSEVNNPAPGALETDCPSNREYKGGFASKLMAKDLDIAIRTGEKLNLDFPGMKMANEIYTKLGKDPRYETLDFGVVYEYLKNSKGN